ncbi:MAG: hypothetical protein ACYCW6_01645 [Candidatus Xenobia bacterium]
MIARKEAAMHITLRDAQGSLTDDIEGLLQLSHWKAAAASAGLFINIECRDFAPMLLPGDRLVVRRPGAVGYGDLVMVVSENQLRFLRVLRSPDSATRLELTTGRGVLEVPLPNVLGKVVELERFGESVTMSRGGFGAHLSRLFAMLRKPAS